MEQDHAAARSREIASGIAGLYAEEAISDLDLDLSLFIGLSSLPTKMICSMLEHVTRLMVVEELEPVVKTKVERLARKVNPADEDAGKGGIHLSRGLDSAEL